VGLKEELQKEVAAIFRKRWSERDGNVVPKDDSITLENDAVNLGATVLYADMADSTKLVDQKTKNLCHRNLQNVPSLCSENYQERGRGYYRLRWRQNHGSVSRGLEKYSSRSHGVENQLRCSGNHNTSHEGPIPGHNLHPHAGNRYRYK
jgi:hypothetical protein